MKVDQGIGATLHRDFQISRGIKPLNCENMDMTRSALSIIGVSAETNRIFYLKLFLSQRIILSPPRGLRASNSSPPVQSIGGGRETPSLLMRGSWQIQRTLENQLHEWTSVNGLCPCHAGRKASSAKQRGNSPSCPRTSLLFISLPSPRIAACNCPGRLYFDTFTTVHYPYIAFLGLLTVASNLTSRRASYGPQTRPPHNSKPAAAVGHDLESAA